MAQHKTKIIIFLISLIVCLCSFQLYENFQGDNSDCLVTNNSNEKHTPAYQDATRKFQVIYKGKVYKSNSYSTSGSSLNYITFE